MRRGVIVSLLCAAASLAAAPARALDKQGSAHGGDIEGATSGFAFGGSASLGVSVFNPTYAARPDNTGPALFRYAAHFDFDLIGRAAVDPARPEHVHRPHGRRHRAEVGAVGARRHHRRHQHLAPRPGRVEGGARIELDGTRIEGGYPRAHVADDRPTGMSRARYLYSLAAIAPRVGEALRGGDVSGWLTLGWFAINRSYFARPNNTGLALFRYAAHAEISFWNDHLALGLDAIFFTDKLASNVFRPSELDFTPELIVRHERYEVHLAYERDMPVDQDSLVQQFVYLLASVSF